MKQRSQTLYRAMVCKRVLEPGPIYDDQDSSESAIPTISEPILGVSDTIDSCQNRQHGVSNTYLVCLISQHDLSETIWKTKQDCIVYFEHEMRIWFDRHTFGQSIMSDTS